MTRITRICTDFYFAKKEFLSAKHLYSDVNQLITSLHHNFPASIRYVFLPIRKWKYTPQRYKKRVV